MNSTSQKTSSTKVMVVGLDGLSLSLLQTMVGQGELPTFGALLKKGASGILQSVTNMTTGPTWVSFSTGCHPDRHGILHDFRHSTDGYMLNYNRGENYSLPNFWQQVSDAGREVIVLNVPLTYPARPVNGVVLAGIDAPNERAAGFSHPPNAFNQVKQATGDYIIDCGLASYMQRGDLEGGVAAIQRETEGRTAAAEHFLAQREWDLFVTVYSLPDVWQHYYWTSKPGSAGHEQMLDGYRQMDQHLARLLKHLPKDGHLIICSDHGFGRLLGTRKHLNEWLAAQGWLTYQTETVQKLQQRMGTFFLNQVRRLVSFRRRQQVLASIPFLRTRVESGLRVGNIDWSNTQVYAAMDHTELWLNVRGRQPHGIVEPSDYEMLCQEVAGALLAWADPNGSPYLLEVNCNAYAQKGDSAPQLVPDLSLVWNPDASTPELHEEITGDHTLDGAWIIAGPTVPNDQLPEHSLVDVAPTVLHLLGVSPTLDLDGSVPKVLLPT